MCTGRIETSNVRLEKSNNILANNMYTLCMECIYEVCPKITKTY